jgi:hypothetical protein
MLKRHERRRHADSLKDVLMDESGGWPITQPPDCFITGHANHTDAHHVFVPAKSFKNPRRQSTATTAST